MSGAVKEVDRRKRIVDQRRQAGNVANTCRYLRISRASFYCWRQKYLERGEPGLVPQKP